MKKFLNKYKYLLVIVLISFTFITIGSKNSPLYLINDWYDAQAFMTMGKGLLNGLIPYKDLFEQKGPILYFIYGIANLISTKTFMGVYLIEIVFFSVFLYFVKKTINLFFDDKYSIPSLIALTFGIMMLSPFGHGGAAEELCLPFFMYSIYSLFKYLKTGEIKMSEILLNGIMAGIVLWVKYTLLGFHFVLAATLFFVNFFNKKYKDAFISSIIYLLGMALVTVPIFIYFSLNNALKELFNVYFLVNMTSYSKIASPIEKVGTAISLLSYNLVSNIPFLLFILIPLVAYAFIKVDLKIKHSKIIILVSVLFMGLGTFIGGTNYFYYSLIITPFMILGTLLLNRLLKRLKIKSSIIRTAAIFILFATLLIKFSPNISYTHLNKEDYAQFIFADIINKEQDKTLINYGFLDGGFYFTTDTIPECYYFMENNLSYKDYPEMYDEQRRYVEENRPHFVITDKEHDFLEEQDYKVISSYRQKYEKRYAVYYLYQR